MRGDCAQGVVRQTRGTDGGAGGDPPLWQPGTAPPLAVGHAPVGVPERPCSSTPSRKKGCTARPLGGMAGRALQGGKDGRQGGGCCGWAGGRVGA